MAKTAEYTRKAIDKYRNQYDFINLRFPEGTKERLEALGIANSDLIDACLQFIDAVENDALNATKAHGQDSADKLAELQAIIDAKNAEKAEEIKNYVQQMKDGSNEKRHERIARYDELTVDEIRAFFCEDGLEFRESISNPANKEAYIAKIGEANYNRCLKIIEEINKVENEQKRAETITAANFAENSK